MEWLQNNDVIINLELFKQYYFYHLFNPNGPKILNYSVHRLIHIVCIMVIICFIIFSALTFVLKTENQVITNVELFLLMFVYIEFGISFLKILVFLLKAGTIWKLFSFTRIDFLASKQCHKHMAILHVYREKSKISTNFLLNYCLVVLIMWMATPLILNTWVEPETPNRRYNNILNLRYPVNTSIFNEYYYAFYLIEVLVCFFLLYYSILIDNYLISFCWTIIAQFEVITCAYKSIGNEEDTIQKLQNGKFIIEYFKDFNF
jgi:hypothetical protein